MASVVKSSLLTADILRSVFNKKKIEMSERNHFYQVLSNFKYHNSSTWSPLDGDKNLNFSAKYLKNTSCCPRQFFEKPRQKIGSNYIHLMINYNFFTSAVVNNECLLVIVVTRHG